MKHLIAEWIEKAEGDFDTMERESRARKKPNYDAVCFHAQQCAEKYLKARMCDAGKRIPRTHDLPSLLDMLLDVEPTWVTSRTQLVYLTQFGVQFRYPGDTATKEHALQARRLCRQFRKIAVKSFK